MTLLERHIVLIRSCYDTEYYPQILYAVQSLYPGFENITDKEIIGFWNDFWLSLPDTPGIRKSPLFYQVCDIAEMIFMEDNEPNWGG